MAVVSKDLLFRLRKVEHANTRLRLGVWQSVDGNPMRASIEEKEWGHIFHYSARPSNSVFNRASATGLGLFDNLEEIESSFFSKSVPAILEISTMDLAGDFEEQGMKRVIERGYNLHSVEGVYYGETDRDYASPSQDVEIVKVQSGEQRKAFTEAYLAGWEYPPETALLWQTVANGMFEDPNFTGYIAMVDGKPAGSAQLHIQDGIGYYADACVRPEFRRRGCQRALFNARLEAARQAGCELIFSIAEFADQSANNMEAFGLRMATETWHWTKSPHPRDISSDISD